MINRKSIILKLAPVALVFVTVSCCVVEQDETVPFIQERLREYIGTIKVVNTHEHQRTVEQIGEHTFNFFTIVFHSYLPADLNSTGVSVSGGGRANTHKLSLDEQWDMYGHAMDMCRNTSYYNYLARGFQLLYGFDEPYFTRENIKLLSAKIDENYKNHERYYDEACKKAGIEIMFQDRPYSPELDKKHHAQVFNVSWIIMDASRRSWMADGDGKNAYSSVWPVYDNPYEVAKEKGYTIETLDDYISIIEYFFEVAKENNAVCLKHILAYYRTLYFEDVPYERAKALYAKPYGALTKEEEKALEDFMFHWLIKKSIEVNLPFQIHTGY
ncbi:MAG: hypothetical protein HOC71_11175, partial [Candidatus Latescibacteria bacterium]|nr:hypothetical protein [Candidatus Latescibacterota bacterium]